MPQACLSSQAQVNLNPPVHFSILKVHRGTINQLTPTGTPVGAPTVGEVTPGTPMPGMVIPVRSITIALDMNRTPFRAGVVTGPALSCATGSPSIGLSRVGRIINGRGGKMQRFLGPGEGRPAGERGGIGQGGGGGGPKQYPRSRPPLPDRTGKITMRRFPLPTESRMYQLPRPPLPEIQPGAFVLIPFSLPAGAGLNYLQYLRWVYVQAFQEAQAAARPSLPERDLLGVWN